MTRTWMFLTALVLLHLSLSLPIAQATNLVDSSDALPSGSGAQVVPTIPTPIDFSLVTAARLELNMMYRKVLAYTVESGTFPTTLKDAGYALPSFLALSLQTKYSATSNGFSAGLIVTGGSLDGAVFSIDHQGSITGMDQFGSLTEVNAYIVLNLKGVYTAEQSYETENNCYTADLMFAGFVPSPVLAQYGSVSVTLSNFQTITVNNTTKQCAKGFTATLKGIHPAIYGSVYKINSIGNIQIQGKMTSY